MHDGHGLMTTVEFPCNPLRTLSPHDTYRGWNSDAHATVVTSTTPCGVRTPCDAHVGTIFLHFFGCFTQGETKNCVHENITEYKLKHS